MRPHRLHLRAVGFAAILLALTVLIAVESWGAKGMTSARSSQGALSADPISYDVRKTVKGVPTRKVTEKAVREFKDEKSQEVVTLNPLTGTVNSLTRWEGEISSPRGRETDAQFARRWLRENYRLLGIDRDDLSSLHMVASERLADGDTRVRFIQTYRGIRAFDNSLTIYLQKHRISALSGSPSRNLHVPSITPKISASRALTKAAQMIPGAPVQIKPRVTTRSKERSQVTSFSGGHSARLVLFNKGQAKTALAWRVYYDHPDPELALETVIDANSGQLLRRENTIVAANAKVWDLYPGAPRGGGDLREVDLSRWLATDASNTLTSNYFKILDANSKPIASPNGEWLYERKPIALTSPGYCPPEPIGCSWNHKDRRSWATNYHQAAVQTFYFLNIFREHLASPPINAPRFGQLPVILSTNLENNAHYAPERQTLHLMFYGLEDPTDPANPPLPYRSVFAAETAETVHHEYTHASMRALNPSVEDAKNDESKAMNEALADFYSTDFHLKQGYVVDTELPGELPYAVWEGGEPNISRSEPLDCTVGADPTVCPRRRAQANLPGQGGYTYADFGRISDKGPEPHYDGEILVQTLLDLRRALVKVFNSEQRGGFETRRLVTEGVRRLPDSPTYLYLRDGILAANDNPAIEPVIWQVFRDRGMGQRLPDRIEVDPDFGEEGQLDFSSRSLRWLVVRVIEAVASDDSDRLVLAGRGGGDAAHLWRLAKDGAVDESFGEEGEANIALGLENELSTAKALLALPNGGVLVAGSASVFGSSEGYLLLRRITSKGSVDPTFRFPAQTLRGEGSSLVVQADGKIVVAGTDGARNATLWRFNADGTPDAGFGQGGQLALRTKEGHQFPGRNIQIALQADGKILLVSGDYGPSQFDQPRPRGPFLQRLDSSGAIDQTFADGGEVKAEGGGTAYDLGVLPDGSVVVAGSGIAGESPIKVWRFTAAGLKDQAFAKGGSIALAKADALSDSPRLAVAPDGSTVVVGRISSATHVWVLDQIGAISHSGSSLVVTLPGGFALQPGGRGGKVVVFGSTEFSRNILVRFQR